jgi:hypothetical protein
MTKDEALDLALEIMYSQGDVGVDEWRAAEAAIKQARSAPVQEPVAWMQSDEVHISLWKDDYHIIPLYTTPPAQPAEWQKIECPICGDMAVATDIPAAKRQWVGLTDEDWKELHLTTNARTYGPAIEAKLKERNV